MSKNFIIKNRKYAVSWHPMSLRFDDTITGGSIIKNFVIPEDITTPSLIIHSKNDGLVNYSHAEYAHQNINDSSLILYYKGWYGALSELKDARKQIKIFPDD